MEFRDFFKKGTTRDPFPYQEDLATGPRFPDLLEAPTGSGKTAAAVMGWLWRRAGADDTTCSATPRRLVYCLPMRTLVYQTYRNTLQWLGNLGLRGRVGIHLLMGGEESGDWDLYPERECILIGTQDMLLSRALNRGYGMSRYRWPMHYGLLNNDCLWVLDEVQLMGSGLATTTQLAAFRDILGTSAGCHCIWMSATMKREWLQSIEFKDTCRSLEQLDLRKADKNAEPMKSRLQAIKVLHRCDVMHGDPKKPKNKTLNFNALASMIKDVHDPGSLTLVVVNTVDRAVNIFKALEKQFPQPGKSKKGKQTDEESRLDQTQPELLLIHSRFRPQEKEEKIKRLDAELPDPGRIVVSTQVIEAGVDLSARTLFTEIAPWASLVQRFGRCNRKGEYDEAFVHWIDLLSIAEDLSKNKEDYAHPYEVSELEAAREQLMGLDNVGPQALERHLAGLDDDTQSSLFPYTPLHVIRKKDIIDLFDTTPDLAGNDIDVSRFIRDGEDLDVQVLWRDTSDQSPSSIPDAPHRNELCPVSLGRFRIFVRSKSAYQWNSLEGNWSTVRAQDVVPGRVFLIPADQGGYQSEIGWNPDSKAKVAVVTLPDTLEINDANDLDRHSTGTYFASIRDHTEHVVQELETIIKALHRCFNQSFCDALRTGARWHDRGKAHHVFQHALEPDEEHHHGCWAKARSMARYERRGFRHELAGALAALQNGHSDLACYLVAAHHGKVRLSIRSLPFEKRPSNAATRFARGVWHDDELPETDLGGNEIAREETLSLEPMEIGLSETGWTSWAERMLDLRDGPFMGPFRLAFLEALLRAADMRASEAGAVKERIDA